MKRFSACKETSGCCVRWCTSSSTLAIAETPAVNTGAIYQNISAFDDGLAENSNDLKIIMFGLNIR